MECRKERRTVERKDEGREEVRIKDGWKEGMKKRKEGTREVKLLRYVITAVYGGGSFFKPNYHMLLCGR